ncbi:MAG: hypothetical protein ACK5P7_03835 [Bdellovibrio sp.]
MCFPLLRRVCSLITLAALLSASFTAKAQDNEYLFSSANQMSDLGLSKWGLSYFNFSSGDMEYVNRGGGSAYIYQYLSFNYKFAPDQRFAIRPAFGTETAGVYDNFGNTRPMSTKLSDLHVTYSNYNLASFPNEFDLSGTFYLYAPTSESAQKKKWAARIRSWLILKRTINRNWTVTYNAKPEYFFNTQKAYRNERENTDPAGQKFLSVRADNNKLGELDHYIEVSRYANKWFTPQLSVGWVYEWYQDSKEADSRDLVSETFKIAPSTWINVNRQLRFIVGVENQVNIRRPSEGQFRLFREQDNQYYLMTFWTIL